MGKMSSRAYAAQKERYRAQIEELYTPQYIKQLGMEYIKGKLPLKDLALKHGIAIEHMYVISKDNKWTEAKRNYTASVLNSAAAKAAAEEGERLAVLMQASTNLDTALLRLAESDEAISTAQDAQYMARALRDAVLAKRNLYNLPTVEEQSRIESATGRMNIEKEKLELMRKAQDEEKTAEEVVVRFAEQISDDISG